MKAALEALAREKAELLARSALCRLHLRRETRALRDSLGWTALAGRAVSAPATRRVAMGLALSVLGMRRAARLVAFAGRAVLLAKLARSAIEMLKRVGAR